MALVGVLDAALVACVVAAEDDALGLLNEEAAARGELFALALLEDDTGELATAGVALGAGLSTGMEEAKTKK